MAPEWFTAATSGTEAGELAARVDWSATPLGPPERWPPGLRTAVELCYGTRFPVLVTWGPELTMLYNDGYREMLGSGKHPRAMGAPVGDVWAEVWETVGPLFDHVLRTGEPTWVVDQRLLVNRSGFEEEAFFTYSYSALVGEHGVEGVLDIATETTEQVISRRRLQRLTALSSGLQAAADDPPAVARAAVEVLTHGRDDVCGAAVHAAQPDGTLECLAAAGDRVAGASAEMLAWVVRSGQALESSATFVEPLVGSGDRRPIGAIALELAPTRPTDDAAREFVGLVRSKVGNALAGAVRRRREVSELRTISSALQRSLLPTIGDSPSIAARYLPAAGGLDVGGDWYDVVALDEARTALLVGDCVGHGLAAAALMGQLRSASRAVLLERHQPAATIAALDHFARELDGAECTTVLCVVVDRAARTLTYASAGHLPALVLRPGGAVWLDVPRGLPLAVGPLRQREEATVPLDGAEALVLYTDGLVERRGESIDVGLRRLAAVATGLPRGLPVERLADRLLADLPAGGAGDDAALLVHAPQPR